MQLVCRRTALELLHKKVNLRFLLIEAKVLWFFVCLFFLLFSFTPLLLQARETSLEHFRQLKTNIQLKKQFDAYVLQELHHLYFPEEKKDSLKLSSWFSKPLPLFVTVKKDNRIRACMGSIVTQTSTLHEELKQKMNLAFFQDIRNPPIKKEELESSVIYITAIGTVTPVSDSKTLNPFREGIYLKAGQKEALYLPGEAKTLDYALKAIRAKAGIRPEERIQIFRIASESVSVKVHF